jgi:peptidoglycan/LPS O-acetylase OafA/YrhL
VAKGKPTVATAASLARYPPGRDPRDRLINNLQRRVIPGLDGIRGIAALSVVMFHGISEHFLGGQAVEMFFLLSGLLITWLLLTEERRTGAISLRAFYWRRAFRLLPAIMALIGWELTINRPRVSYQSTLAVACYYANYYSALGGHLDGLIHTWSLAVEEHFYLIWPAIFVFTANRTRLMKLLLAAILVSAAYRVVIARILTPTYAFNATEANATALILGCAIALLIWNTREKIPLGLFHPLLAPLSLLAIVCLAQLPKETQYIWLVRYTHLADPPLSWAAIPAAAVLLATISHYVVERPAQSAGRMLLARMNFSGGILIARVSPN